MPKWFYITDGKPAGPIEPAALKQLATSGRLKPTDKLACKGTVLYTALAPSGRFI
jgi:hypothetical protein